MRLPLALLASALLGSLALAGCLSPQGPSPTGGLPGLPFVGDLLAPPPKFGAPVVVDAELGGSEPSLVVDPEGRIFVAAPTGLGPNDGQLSGQFWRSVDGGTTFEHLEGLGAGGLYGPSVGGGDSDIASDASGNLYAIDLWLGNVGFLASEDHGDTWRGSPVTFVASGTDRQWLDVNQATGEVYITVNSLSTGLWVIKSSDKGLTFPQQTLAVPHQSRGGCICPPGVLAVDEATGNVYLPYYLNPRGVGLAVSKDGGQSFETLEVPGTESSRLADEEGGEAGGSFVALAHDLAGNLYLAWESVTEQGRRIVLQVSRDQGASWSLPQRVAELKEGFQIFPWVAAGQEGRAAVAWYEASGSGSNLRWDVRLAVGEQALGAAPFRVATLNQEPVHGGAYDRGLLGDFFEIAVGPDGALHAVWNARLSDGRGAIVHARQTEGPWLLQPGERAPEALVRADAPAPGADFAAPLR